MSTSAAKSNAPPEPVATPLFRAGIFLVLTLLALYGLWGYGIWDPWEVSVADAARKLAEGEATDGTISRLSMELVKLGFGVFGTREWAGRLPIALCGVGLLGVSYAWARRFADATTALYTVIALGTTPLFLFHSREMMGAAPTFLCSALVMLGASGLAFSAPADRSQARWPFALALVVGSGLGLIAAGAMLAVAPALLAVSLVAWLAPDAEADNVTKQGRIAVSALAGLVLALVVTSLFAHNAATSVWTGGAPYDAPLSTYERSIAELFHGFAPWSAVLPVALASALRADDRPTREFQLRLVCVVWAALAYAAQTIFLSSFGSAAFPAPLALGLAAALWLRDRERDPRAFWPELAVIVLVALLIIRDFALYPGSPISALGIDAKPPEVFNPKRAWALCVGAFAVAMVVACASVPEARTFDVRAPYRALRAMWTKGGGYRGWIVTLVGLVLYLLVFGVLAWTVPRTMHFSSIVTRIGRVALFVPFAVPLVIAALQWGYARAPRLAEERMLPTLLAALVVGAYASQRFMPELATHLSPRVVFDTYNKLAQSDEPLAQFRVQGRAAAYYAKGKVEDVQSTAALTDFLAVPQRRWAVIAADQLAEADVAFRRKAGNHLFVASMENAKLTLVANQAVPKARDLNPLAKFVVKVPPKMQVTTPEVEFDNGIQLLGYTLELPRKDSVGPGQSFHITWVWRANKNQSQPFQVFFHGDGPNERINGDHDPVDGKYPVKLWMEGDIVVDRQKLNVPATAPAGAYGLYVGLFHGDTRSKITGPASDGTNRARVGSIQVQ